MTAGGSDKSPGGMSSTTLKEDDVVRCCASCGIAEVDNIRLLQDCTACNLVRFCSIECQREHSLQHKHDCCSTKRVLTTAESRDEILFKQPERTHDGDCPICLIPLSIDLNKSTMMACCSKVICIGCDYAIQIREVEDRLDSICPFCREHIPTSQEEADRNRMKRIEVNDPVAIRQMGARYCSEGDYKSAFQYYTKAAELGDVGAHYELSLMYRDGKVVEKDKEKELYLLEQAAIRGHPFARHNLGCAEWKNDRHDRAMKHFIIAAKLGHDNSLGALKLGFQRGLVSKEDLQRLFERIRLLWMQRKVPTGRR